LLSKISNKYGLGEHKILFSKTLKSIFEHCFYNNTTTLTFVVYTNVVVIEIWAAATNRIPRTSVKSSFTIQLHVPLISVNQW